MDVRACAADAAPVRAEPDDAAEQVTQALRGEPLAVESLDGDWARITTAYGYPGWIQAEALGGEADGEWPGLPRAGDHVQEGAGLPRRAVRVGRSDRERDRLLWGSCTWPTGALAD